MQVTQPIQVIIPTLLVRSGQAGQAGQSTSDRLSDFDEALIAISKQLLVYDLMKNENGNVDFNGAIFLEIEEYLNVPMELSTITLIYSLDYNQVLAQVSVTYDQTQVKDVRDLLRVIGEFYDTPLTVEQLASLRTLDPNNEACFCGDVDNPIYNALIHNDGMRTGISYIGRDINNNYIVDLDLSN